ncbi:response regulator transcription factor [Aliikangiella sp. G2MR2-5]|uniref:response regulator transcription factor n=1 Tax=Aliikangiella sp. G2MR2-5 TaxID=2788943 RepID=UPI0018AB7BB0|nr:response regulator transcription factor [Aliikangiella sp. G2MR2-5]
MNQSLSLQVLLIEDNTDLAGNIIDYLEQRACTMDYAKNGAQGLSLALDNYYDLVILDLMLPGLDGIEVCRQIRKLAERYIPVIMLTARDSLQDKVFGFEQGADDYLTKPFALEELFARCLAISKRNQINQSFSCELGELKLDKKRKEAFRQGKSLELSSMGYKILSILVDAHPQVITRSELINRLWGDNPTESDSLRSHIYQLRKALDKPFERALLKTLHGVGFGLDID